MTIQPSSNINSFVKKSKKAIASLITVTALFAPSFPSYAESWTDTKILLDDSTLDEKMHRYDNKKSYRSAVNNLAEDEKSAGVTSSMEQYKRYIPFWHGHFDTDTSVYVLLGAGGMTKTNVNSLFINENVQYLVDCRSELIKPDTKKTYSKFLEIRGCAKDRIEEHYAPTNMSEDEVLRNITLDSDNITQKITKYKNKDKYQTAVAAQKRLEVKQGNINDEVGIYDDMKIWNAVLNTEITLDTFNGNSDVFTKLNIYSPYMNYNMSLLFECRDKLLIDPVPEKLSERRPLYNTIYKCWKNQTKENYRNYLAQQKDILSFIQADPRPLSVKLAEKSNSDTYEDAVKKADRAEASAERITNKMWGSENIMLWSAHLDISITPDQLSSQNHIELRDDDYSYLNYNAQTILDCRDEIIQETALKDIQNPKATYKEVNNCAWDKINYRQDIIRQIDNAPDIDDDTSVEQYELLQKSFTDTNITKTDFNKVGFSQKSFYDFDLTAQFQTIIDCRTEILTEPTTITKNQQAQKVRDCANDKMQVQFDADETSVAKKSGYGILAFGGLVGAGFAASAVAAARKRKQSQPKLKKN